MTLDLRTDARQHYAHLVRDGAPGWHPYCLEQAEAMVKGDPIVHGGLVAHVEAEIGPKATAAARKVLEWFNKPRRRAQ